MSTLSSSSDTITVSASGGIGHLRLNRPAARNAFNRELIDALAEASQWFDRQPQIKVVIVSGEGKSFCAGFDLSQFSANSNAEDVRASVEAGRRMIQIISKMRATTIAAVHGHCIGGGWLLMLACDFRYASNCASFRLPEADIGIPLAWGAVPWLTREAGSLLASELILTCRELGAAEALSRGMVNGVFDASALMAEVTAVADRLSLHSPLILETTKAQLAAAKQSLCPDGYGFTDAHVLYSALSDEASVRARNRYLELRKKPQPVN